MRRGKKVSTPIFKNKIVIKAVFVLGENHFRKSFSPKPACLAITENDIFWKMTSSWPIFSPLTRKWFSPLIFTSKHFRKERERERERESPDQRESERRESPDRRAPIVDRAARRTIAPRRWAARSSGRSHCSSIDERRYRPSGAIVDRATRRMIAPISPSPRDLIFSSATRSQFDWI